jgi:hypothetical protein
MLLERAGGIAEIVFVSRGVEIGGEDTLKLEAK